MGEVKRGEGDKKRDRTKGRAPIALQKSYSLPLGQAYLTVLSIEDESRKKFCKQKSKSATHTHHLPHTLDHERSSTSAE